MRTIDPSTLPSHFDSAKAEAQWQSKWDQMGLHRYDQSRSREETFVVDTPPPTVSGSLHVGHVFSYTHTDLIARYQRMRGRNIFYPMGWDDNGLPTERRVQNYFNVRCSPDAPPQPDVEFKPADPKDKTPPRLVSRSDFIQLCLQLTQEDEKAFKALWRQIGLSVDWEQEYSTIEARSRHLAQLSFLDLYGKGYVYQVDSPTMWDVDFQTAVAQAEVEDRSQKGHLHNVRFGIEGSDELFTIATTRPEFLAACVGVTAHPEDGRYKHLFGKRAVTPLFRVPVPIFPSKLADPEKGTGILMVCTFGDATDVQWWRDHKLQLRQILARDGRLAGVRFGSEGWESKDPDAANRFYSELAGKTVKSAQVRVVELLRDSAGAASGSEPPLAGEPTSLDHPVKFFEKGDRPLEFLPTRQWFVRLLDKKDALITKGDEIAWHPDYMRLRYRNWTENLQFDWCISRQRYFGVPFPLWYSIGADGLVDYSRPIVAAPEQLPVDPMSSAPASYDESQRDKPGGFTGEADVFDTWFTSSLTPQIGSKWLLDPERHGKLFPSDLRPQSHEIIRTWAFYTIAKALLHEDSIPWKNVAISGWILDPDRKKMSKSRGNVLTPMHLLEEYGSDPVRYWAANARLGADTAFDEKVFKVGKRLVTKLFNAGKFVLSQSADNGPIHHPLDVSFLLKLKRTVERATAAFESFEYSVALDETERFFWSGFTDSYLELVKMRSKSENDSAGRASAVGALRFAFGVLLRMFAPFLPYITEEVWSWVFAEELSEPSIHKAPWPASAGFGMIPASADAEIFDAAVACQTAVHKQKGDAKVSVGRPIDQLTLVVNNRMAGKLEAALSDVAGAVRARSYKVAIKDDLADGVVEVRDIAFAAEV